MEPGSPVLEDLDGLLGLFSGSQVDGMSVDLLSGQNSFDLDAGGPLGHLEAAADRFAGGGQMVDLVSGALRAQPEPLPLPLTVSDKDIRPSVPTPGNPQAAAAVVPPPPTQFTIRPMPARKSNAPKPAAAVKAEPLPAEPLPQPPQQQAKPQQQPQPQEAKKLQQQAKPKSAAKAKLQQQQQQQQLLQLQEEADTAAFDSDSTEPSSAPGGKRRRRIRNAKQQELNRLAQQRYRERKKQKYSVLQGTVDELSIRLGQLNTLEAANSELQQRNLQLETVVKDQSLQLRSQQDTIAKQAQQLQTQAAQLQHQAQQLQQQVQRIEQQDQHIAELASKAAGNTNSTSCQTADASSEVVTDEKLTLAIRAVLAGVSSMTSMLPDKDAQQMQQMVTQLPDSLLQQLRSCCREVALHLKQTEVKEQPLAVSVPCC